MINTLPLEVLRLVIFSLPAQDIPVTSMVNKYINSEISREGFWKELCQHNYYSTKDFTKPAKESWQQHAQRLEKAVKWNECNSSLKVSNKGYTLTLNSNNNNNNNNNNSNNSISFGVAEKPLKEGPFSGRYFEVTIEQLPESKETPQIIVGIAPYNILDNPVLGQVRGYVNTGKVDERAFGKEYGVGDTIGVLLHTEYMTLTFFKNSQLQGTPYAHLSKEVTWHPVVGLMNPSTNSTTRISIPLPPRVDAPHMPLS